MKIGIFDAELIAGGIHPFPNLASMKLSAWHKSIGDIIELGRDYKTVSDYDKVYISKVFTETDVPEYVLKSPNVEYGGTGFFYEKAPALPYEIEHIKPDYDLYTEWINERLEGLNPSETARVKKRLSAYTDYSIGFTTRGCIRGCSFCVNQNYRKCVLHSPVSEFLEESRKYIYLLDDNVLACPDWKKIFHDLQSTGKCITFRQGFDERLLTKEKCDEIFLKTKWIGDYIFAFDNIKDRDVIEKNIKLMREYKFKRNLKFYVFCGYNHDDPGNYDYEFWKKDIEDLFERISILAKYGCLPYIMRFQDYEKSPFRGMYITIARWCNQPTFFKKLTFREFCMREGQGDSPERYMREFEESCPEVAKKYYDKMFVGE
jgi:hypothetical protein